MAGQDHPGQQTEVAKPSRALQRMEEANRIIEDFPVSKFALYLTLFLIQAALCFWISLTFTK